MLSCRGRSTGLERMVSGTMCTDSLKKGIPSFGMTTTPVLWSTTRHITIGLIHSGKLFKIHVPTANTSLNQRFNKCILFVVLKNHRKGRWVAPDKFAGKNLTQQNRPKVKGRETVFSPSYRPEILTVAFSVRLISTIKISALLLG